MGNFQVDPLDGLEQRPLEVQVAVLANEMRNQRNMLYAVQRKLDRTMQGVWALAASIIAGIVIFLVTSSHDPHPAAGSGSGSPAAHLTLGGRAK